LEKVCCDDSSLPAGTGDHEFGVQGYHRCGKIAGWIGVYTSPANGSSMPDLRVGHLLDASGDQRCVLGDQRITHDFEVWRHRPDDDRVTVVADALERIDLGQVDQQLGRCEPELHHRQQALPTSNDLGIIAALGEQLQRLIDAGGRLVVESRGDHACPPSVSK
jgi:hypothetical protein